MLIYYSLFLFTCIVVDSEGLSAPGNSEDYDAKIFAVTALLSGHLLYNDLKVIDSASLDYLQILARRAQLFSLKSALNNRNDVDLEAAISFPPMTWVVQDFFLDMADSSESPTEWLHRLVREQHKFSNEKAITDKEGAESLRKEQGPALDSIFPELSCKTVIYNFTLLTYFVRT